MKPILFNTYMVQALLAGTKTCTRRVIKPQPPATSHVQYTDGKFSWAFFEDSDKHWIRSPYQPGDILYVRETWQYAYDLDENEQIIEGTGRYLYAADGETPFNEWIMPDGTYRERMPWRPSIHMPREAARIFLRVTDVRVEQLLTPFFADCAAVLALKKEGMMLPTECVECIGNYGTPACVDVGDDSECGILDEIRGDFSNLWDTTIKPADLPLYGWNANPWVWVIEFERCEKPEE